MQSKINKIITLEDSSSYLVFDHAKYKNRSFLFVNRLTKSKKDLSEAFLIFEEKYLNDEIDVSLVEDEDILERLTHFFRKGLQKDLELEKNI